MPHSPPVTQPSLENFASPQAWEDDLVERLTTELSARLSSDLSNRSHHYEVIQTHNLSEQSPEVLEKLLMGRVFDAESHTLAEKNEDYLFSLDTTAIKNEAENIFSEWQEEIDALAEAMEEDSEDLQERWLDSDEFSRSELDTYLHFDKHEYQGEVAGVAELPFDLSLDPKDDELWECLTLFRINARDFLAMAKKEIENECADDNGVSKNQNCSIWGLLSDDSGEDGLVNAVDIYERNFLKAQECMQKRTLRGFNDFNSGDEAITVNEFFSYVKTCVYGSQTKTLAYLQLCLGSDTIEGFSKMCNRHDYYNKDLTVTIASGYLSSDDRPGFVNDASCIQLRKPIDLAISRISISKESPDNGCDTLLLPAVLQLHAELYELLVIDFQEKVSSVEPALASEKKIRDTAKSVIFDKAIALLDLAPLWVAHSIECAQSFPEFLPNYQACMATKVSQDACSDFDHELLGQIERMKVGKFQHSDQKAIDVLLRLGAKAFHENATGTNAFELGVIKLLPLPTLQALYEVTNDPSERGINQKGFFERVVRADSLCHKDATDDQKKDRIATLLWLIENNVVPESSALNYAKSDVLQKLERMDEGPVIIAALNSLESQAPKGMVQGIKDQMLFEAAYQLREPLLSSLLRDGANINGERPSQFKNKTIEQVIQEAASYHRFDENVSKKIDACNASLRPARLRANAMALIEEMTNEMPLPSYARP